MSLLLDALKKAEEAKRQAALADSGVPLAATPRRSELSLEPADMAPAQTVSPLPDLSAHLATVDADLAAVTNDPPLRPLHEPRPKRETPALSAQQQPPAAMPGTNADQEAARQLFAAKRTPTPGRKPLWIALAAAAVVAVGIGGWFWWQLQTIGNASLQARPLPPPTQPAAQSPLPPTPPQPVAAMPAPPAQPVVSDTPPATPLPPPTPEPRSEKRAASLPEAESPVRITRGELRVSPTLAQAYDRLQADDLAGASQAYEQVLKGDAKNSDALLGMAAIAIRRGDLPAAESWYVRALEADPRDANAQAGLVNLRGQANPAAAESRLKSLLAAQPDSATLNFALGNLYAAQRRWPEAQLAYFNAHTAEPGNADYLFNLAASLDNMHLPKIAIDYYRAALAAAGGRRAGFDPAQVQARIRELQP